VKSDGHIAVEQTAAPISRKELAVIQAATRVRLRKGGAEEGGGVLGRGEP